MPLGVVEAVHRQQDLQPLEAAAVLLEGLLRALVLLDEAQELVGRDADGQGLQARVVRLPLHAVHPALRAADAQQRGPEVLEVGVGLEGEEVGAEEAAQQL
jgi:hypothetical protein